MQLAKVIPIIICSILVIVVSGCASQPKYFIPDNLPASSNDVSRIIVTREEQIAGMTTPIYIIDAGENLQTNATVKIRVGEWRKATTSHLYFTNVNVFGKQLASGFSVAPTMGITFAETGQTLDDLVTKNVDAVVYVDYLRCDPDKVSSVYCGNGENYCDKAFSEQLTSSDGMIIGDSSALQPVAEDESVASILENQAVRELYGQLPLSNNSQKRFREVQVIGKISGGDTLVWDRPPGIMRVGSLWGSSSKHDQTLEFTPVNMKVQAGKTYHIHYTINLGERWRIIKVE